MVGRMEVDVKASRPLRPQPSAAVGYPPTRPNHTSRCWLKPAAANWGDVVSSPTGRVAVVRPMASATDVAYTTWDWRAGVEGRAGLCAKLCYPPTHPDTPRGRCHACWTRCVRRWEDRVGWARVGGCAFVVRYGRERAAGAWCWSAWRWSGWRWSWCWSCGWTGGWRGTGWVGNADSADDWDEDTCSISEDGSASIFENTGVR